MNKLVYGFLIGIAFGFFLHKGGVTQYDVIVKQLLLEDMTAIKVMLTAIVTGMIGVHIFKSLGLITLVPKPGSVGGTVLGGLIFGVGFALLGYCPGTAIGAVGQGSLDAFIGGIFGITLGTWLFSLVYPLVNKTLLNKLDFGSMTLPELVKMNPWAVVIPISVVLTFVIYLI